MERYRADYIYQFDKQQALYEDYARKCGIQGKSQQILMWLYYNPQGITQKRIVEGTYSTKQVVHATIKRMNTLGYIELRENPGDKRHKLLYLTDEGRQFAASVLDPLRDIEAQAMDALTPEEQATYVALTRKYTNKLQQLMKGRTQHD